MSLTIVLLKLLYLILKIPKHFESSIYFGFKNLQNLNMKKLSFACIIQAIASDPNRYVVMPLKTIHSVPPTINAVNLMHQFTELHT